MLLSHYFIFVSFLNSYLKFINHTNCPYMVKLHTKHNWTNTCFSITHAFLSSQWIDFPLIRFNHIKLVQGNYFIIQCGNESHYPVMTHFSCEGVALVLTCQHRVDTIILKQCAQKDFQSPTYHKYFHTPSQMTFIDNIRPPPSHFYTEIAHASLCLLYFIY